MTLHDPDREYQEIPLPDGDDELTAVLNEAIDLDRGWQDLRHREIERGLLEKCPGADLPIAAELPIRLDLPGGPAIAITFPPVMFLSCENSLPYGIDALLQDVGREVQSIQKKAKRYWARANHYRNTVSLAARLSEQVDQLQTELRARTKNKEAAFEAITDCLCLADFIAECNENFRGPATRRLARAARDVQRLLEDLDRLIARLFDDTDVPDPRVPVRPGP